MRNLKIGKKKIWMGDKFRVSRNLKAKMAFIEKYS
jgi:hypothetical protein